MKLTPWQIAVLVFAVILLAMRIGGGTVGSPPPFTTDKLAVAVIEESSHRGQYTRDQLDVIQATDAKSVKVAVETRGGQFQVIDPDTADNLAKSAPWITSAMAAKRDSLPWLIGATPRSGFSVPLTTEADALKRVEGLR